MNMATKSVIHQKNRLIANQPQKLWPLLLAMLAGSKAKATHINSKNMNHKKVIVVPSIVTANMVRLLSC